MSSGINQNIELFGRTFHVQTEVIPGDSPLVRTTVFVGGRIIGVRETPLADIDGPEEDLRARINAQHALIVDNLHQRIDRFKAAQAAEVDDETSSNILDSIPDLGEVARPFLEGDAILGASIRVRRLLARFRSAVDVTPPRSPEDLVNRLAGARELIEEVVEFPTFADIRIDEQVRFNVLREGIGEWLEGDRNHDDGVGIWSDVVVFSAYLGRINDRRELMDFDRAKVCWALATIATSRDPRSVVDHLGALYGRDVELDRFIEDPDAADGDHLVAALLRLYNERD